MQSSSASASWDSQRKPQDSLPLALGPLRLGWALPIQVRFAVQRPRA